MGALGVAANYVVLVAKLVVAGTSYGPHAFFIQIRDLTTHEPLEGISVGDIGPKLGFPAVDNGFLRFNNVKVSSECMLNRFARVNSGGVYEMTDPNAIKILYSSFVKGRADIASDAWVTAAKCATIAIRYSLFRRQFPDLNDPTQERLLLDYQNQQYKLFRVLSTAYALVFAGNYMRTLFQETMRRLDQGDDSMLSDAHGLVSLYKAQCSGRTVEAAELARRACGGQGYLAASGLPSLLVDSVATCTYDGDNDVLVMQTARHLVKLLEQRKHLNEKYQVVGVLPQRLNRELDVGSAEFHRACFAHIAYYSVNRLFRVYTGLVARGIRTKEIWGDYLQVEAVHAGEAFFSYCLHEDFEQGIELCSDSTARSALEDLRKILAVNELDKYKGLLVEQGASFEALEGMGKVVAESLKRIRPVATQLVDSFEFSDYSLNSVIARKDGKVYEHMLKQAVEYNPVNVHKVFPGISKNVRKSPNL